MSTLLFSWSAQIFAQDDGRPPVVQIAEDCERVERLLSLPATPDRMVQGGAELIPNGALQASTISANDAGDRWWSRLAAGTATLSIDGTLPVQVQLFQGLQAVGDPQRIEPNQAPISFNVPTQAFYTFLVTRADFADASQIGDYTISVQASAANGLGSPIEAIGTSPSNDVTIAQGAGLVTLTAYSQRDPVQAVSHVGAVDRISAVSGGSLVLIGSSGSQLRTPPSDLSELALVDGALGLHLNTPFGERSLYIEDYTLTSNLDFPQYTSIQQFAGSRQLGSIDWETLETAYLLPNCMGLKFVDGRRTLIVEGEGFRANTNLNSAFTIANSVDVRSGPIDYNFDINWSSENGQIDRIFASGGVIDLDFSDGRSVRIDRPQVTIDQDGDETRFSIDEKDPADADATLISTDWDNLSRIEVLGEQVTLRVNDRRAEIVRNGPPLALLESRAEDDASDISTATFQLTWGDGSRSLLLPEGDDFIELFSPAALAAYDPALKPGAQPLASDSTGFLPANRNNAGQECFSVNTAFALNCAANGLVNPANGGLSLSVVDLHGLSGSLDLMLTRTYNSHNAAIDGPFGPGWNTDFLLDFAVDYDDEIDSRRIEPQTAYPVALDVTQAPLGRIVYTTASGSRHLFTREADRWVSATMPSWALGLRADALLDGWLLLRDDGRIEAFDRAGRLVRVSDVNSNNALTVERLNYDLLNPDSADGLPIYRVSDHSGRSIDFYFDEAQHIVRAEYRADDTVLETINYSYDATGRLSAVAGSNYQANYAYDAETGYLTRYDDPHGPLASTMHYHYDEFGRVLAMDIEATTLEQCGVIPAEDEEPERPFRCYRYEETDRSLETTVTDEWGREETWVYAISNDPETAYRLTDMTRAGLEQSYEYLTTDFPALPSLIDSDTVAGNVRLELEWERGLLASAERNRTRLDYVAERDATVIVPLGATAYELPLVTTYRVDGEDINPVQISYEGETALTVTDAAGLETRISLLDAASRLPVSLATDDETVSLSYDEVGRVIRRSDALGTHRLSYDAYGRLSRYRLEDVSGSLLADYAIAFAPSAETGGLCETVTDSLTESQTRYCRDARQRLVEMQMQDAAGAVLSQTHYRYDAFDRLLSETRSIDGSCERDGACVTTRYSYGVGDAVGQRTVVVQQPTGLTQAYLFDAQDRLLRVTDERGGVTNYEYGIDDNDLGSQPRNRFDNVPYIVRVTAPNGAQTAYGYSPAGQLCRLAYGTEMVWQVNYVQGSFNCTTSIDPRPVSMTLFGSGLQSGNATVAHAYDDAGRLTGLTFNLERPSDNNPANLTTDAPTVEMTYEYDAQGRLVRLVDGFTDSEQGLSYSIESDTDFRLVTLRSAEREITLAYDALERLRRVENAETGTLSYAYSVDSTTGYRQVEATFTGSDGDSATWVLLYDAIGNLRQWIDEHETTTLYEYDQLSRLLRVSRVDPIAGEERLVANYTYDERDNLVFSERYDGREQHYTYDDLNQLVSTRDVDGLLTSYSYDPFGNLMAVTDGLGFSTRSDYDALNRITSITDPTGAVLNYDWSGIAGGELLVTAPAALNSTQAAVSTRYYFDLFNRLWQINDAADNTHRYGYSDGGQLTSAAFWNAELELQLAFNPDGLLQSVTGPDDFGWAWQRDALGRLTQRTDAADGALEIAYDRLGRVLSISDETGDFEQGYQQMDASAVILNTDGTATRYSRDYLGRLTGVIGENESRSLVYEGNYPAPTGYTETDALGIQRQVIVAPALNSPLAPTVTECFTGPDGVRYAVRTYDSNERGELVAITEYNYFSGDAPCDAVLGSPDNAIRSDNTIAYDAAGRPTRFTDAEGNVFAYTYDGRGNLTTVQYPDGRSYTYTDYDALNRPNRLLLPNNQALTLRYDEQRRLNCILVTGDCETGVAHRFDYTALGWLSAWTLNGTTPLTFSYDNGLLTGWSGAGDEAVQLDRANDAFHTVTPEGDSNALVANLRRAEIGYALDWVDSDGAILMTSILNGYQQPLLYRLGDGAQLSLDYNAEDLGEDRLSVTVEWGEGELRAALDLDRLGAVQILRYLANDGTEPAFQQYRYSRDFAGVSRYSEELVGAEVSEIRRSADSQQHPTGETIVSVDAAQTQAADTVRYALIVTYDELGNRARESRTDVDGTRLDRNFQYDGLAIESVQAAAPTTLPVSLAWLPGVFLFAVAGWRLRRLRWPLLLSAMLVVVVGAVFAQDSVTTYTVNEAGQVAAIASGENSIALSYDGYGRITEIAGNAGSSSFTYGANGLLSEWRSAVGTSAAYAYQDGQLVYIASGSDQWGVVALGSMSALVSNSAEPALYDGTGTLRQLGTARVTLGQAGRVLTGELPATVLPVFDGMIYEAAYGLYIAADGRAYDPATGRYLQRSLTQPNLIRNPYSYTTRNETPPNQVRSASPYYDALAALGQASEPPPTRSAADVLAANVPSLDPRWQPHGFAALQQYNQFIAEPYANWAANTHTLLKQINAVGLLPDAEANLRFYDLSAPTRPVNLPLAAQTSLPTFDSLPQPAVGWRPQDVTALMRTPLSVPTWYDAREWWGIGATTAMAYSVQAPQLDDLSAATDVLPYPLLDMAAYATPLATLEALPLQSAEALIASIDEAMLPLEPDALPTSAEAWLSQWLTPQTFAPQAQLEQLFAEALARNH